MNAPEIRPCHDHPEKRWVVYGNYRVAFDVSGDPRAVVAGLRRACVEMLRLMVMPKVEAGALCGAKKEGEAATCILPGGHDRYHVGRGSYGRRVTWW